MDSTVTLLLLMIVIIFLIVVNYYDQEACYVTFLFYSDIKSSPIKYNLVVAFLPLN
jgi:hypothetical protein